MMGRCRFRPLGYRIGLVFVIVGCALVALGYSFPTWLRLSRRLTQGLWHVCGPYWAVQCSPAPPRLDGQTALMWPPVVWNTSDVAPRGVEHP
ncbi:hypothetical protein ACOMHN_064753 [Nucella lapillus]